MSRFGARTTTEPLLGAAARVPVSSRPAASFARELRDPHDAASRSDPRSGVRPVARRPEQVTTQKMPAVRLETAAVHARAPGVDMRVLVAARLVSGEERAVLEALDRARDTTELARTSGIAPRAVERVLGALVRRKLVVAR